MLIDEAGLIVVAEPACAALFQWQPAELVGQPLEILLVAGTDKIRQQLVPDLAPPGPGGRPPAKLFALAQRKDGTSFPVAVTLELRPPAARCWWAVVFHEVNSSVRSENPGLRYSTSAPRPRRVKIAARPGLESIPDIFHQVPVKPALKSDAPGKAATVAPEPSTSANAGQNPQAAPAAAPAVLDSESLETRIRELEQRLSESAEELTRTRAHVQHQDEQLNAANAAAQQAMAAVEAQAIQGAQLEEELTQARQGGDELKTRLSAEQQARAESEARTQELEQRLARSAEELKRAQTQSQPPPAPAPIPSEDEPALRDQLLELEARLRAAVTSLARAGAELETERGQRRRSEQRAAILAGQMQRLHEDLKHHVETGQSNQQRIAELERQRQQNAADLAGQMQQLCEDLKHRLETGQAGPQRIAELEQQHEQRVAAFAAQAQQLHDELQHHLEAAQASQQRIAQLEQQLQEQTRQNDLALGKLQSALQHEAGERARVEAELARARVVSTDSARAGRALVKGLRRQLQPPVESLHEAACRLLQLELSGDQKQLAQTMLENTLFVQTSLQEPPEA